jgi:hypothetical protein
MLAFAFADTLELQTLTKRLPRTHTTWQDQAMAAARLAGWSGVAQQSETALHPAGQPHRTNETCTPRLRWMPAHARQMYTP